MNRLKCDVVYPSGRTETVFCDKVLFDQMPVSFHVETSLNNYEAIKYAYMAESIDVDRLDDYVDPYIDERIQKLVDTIKRIESEISELDDQGTIERYTDTVNRLKIEVEENQKQKDKQNG